MSEHKPNDNDCPYKPYGCEETFNTKESKENHMKSEINYHHLLTLKENESLQRKNNENQKEILDLNKELTEIKAETRRIITNLDYYNDEILREVKEFHMNIDNKIKCTCNNINSNLEACRNVYEVNNKMIKSMYEILRSGRNNSYL